jgi:hypothetical protein
MNRSSRLDFGEPDRTRTVRDASYSVDRELDEKLDHDVLREEWWL